MKKIFVLTAIMALLVSCSDSSTELQSTNTENGTSTDITVSEFYAFTNLLAGSTPKYTELSGMYNPNYFSLYKYQNDGNIYGYVSFVKSGTVTLTPYLFYSNQTCPYYIDDKAYSMSGNYYFTGTTDSTAYYIFNTPVTFSVNANSKLTLPAGVQSLANGTKTFTLEMQ